MNNTIVTSFVFGCFILASGGDESNNCISNCFSVSSSNLGCDPERSFFALLPSMLILFVSESDLENTKEKQTKIEENWNCRSFFFLWKLFKQNKEEKNVTVFDDYKVYYASMIWWS